MILNPNDNYKYIWNPTDVDEMYDIKEDPAEMINLIGTSVEEEKGPYYRKLVKETFSGFEDKLITNSKWMRVALDK